ncbi:hypothetical protein ACIBHX_46725 [Nonomuraea sp. NPDC050536]|uniref:hypothetical protein n=1 Tax=Nonomuraea sp. NPDC050536 TaxID=3364366 RepID=UPI0037C76CF0
MTAHLCLGDIHTTPGPQTRMLSRWSGLRQVDASLGHGPWLSEQRCRAGAITPRSLADIDTALNTVACR